MARRWIIGTIAVLGLSASAAAQQQPPSTLTANQPASLGIAPPVIPTAARPPQPAPQPRRDNPTTSIQEFVRIEGHAKSPLRGIGIVTGLKATGDAGSELLLARPLAKVYEHNGVLLPELKDLAKSKTAAIVMLSCEIPEEGARPGDTFDVYITVSHSAASLKGGVLMISPLMGPLPGQGVYAYASGLITIEDPDVPTSGRIIGGAQVVRDVRPKAVGDTFDLIVNPCFRSFAMSRTLANEINGITADLESTGEAETIATAIDDSTIRVLVPPEERANPAGFIANVMTKRFSPSLIDLPAMVVVNERTGSIIITGNVEISAVTVGNDKLVVTTATPPPVPTTQDPQITRENWARFGTTATSSDRARIQDLLEAFKAINVPVKDQIQILAQIYQTGRLHARFVRE